MINQDKVKLMARIQHFENTEKEALKAYSMYKRDYMGLFLMRSFASYILLLCLFVGGFCLYHMEDLLQTVTVDTIIAAAKGMLYGFGLLLIPVMIVSYIIYWFRYRKAMKKMRVHLDNMKKMNNFYNQETESAE